MGGRVRQVWYYLQPGWNPAEVAWASEFLNPAQLTLFQQLARPDQAHALRVARRLAQQNPPAWVLEAALLHDCGKPADFGLVARCAGVMLSPFGRIPPEGTVTTGITRWRQVYHWHDAWGLRAAETAGTSPEALQLLRAYAQPKTKESPQPWLEALQQADDRG